MLDEFKNHTKNTSDGKAGFCKVCDKKRQQEFYLADPKRTYRYQRKYRIGNRAKVNARNRLAKLRRRKYAVVAWADQDKIKEFYEKAARMTLETGKKYEVDHIIPIKGKLVCGLHVESNLQVISRSENARKRNSF